jgi:quercetin dioxygenase-like cupin family protein
MKPRLIPDRVARDAINAEKLTPVGRVRWGAAAALLAGTLFAAPALRAADERAGVEVKPVLTEKLPNVPGKSVTSVLVTYAPGGKSGKHHHAGSVLVYILSGAVRSETSTGGPAKIYQAGESFFEPPGSEHLVSENASATEPASLLAVFVAEDGAQLTAFDQ